MKSSSAILFGAALATGVYVGLDQIVDIAKEAGWSKGQIAAAFIGVSLLGALVLRTKLA